MIQLNLSIGVSLRLPEIMIDDLKVLANKRDVPYQSLMKIFLAERIVYELGGLRSGGGQSQSTSAENGSV